MSDWLYLGLNPKKFTSNEDDSGVTIRTSPSPYDIPEAARKNFDETRKFLSIEFQYISNEPVKSITEEDGISFRLGKNSGRLYAIDVELKKVTSGEATIDRITERIAKIIGGLAVSSNLPARTNNYSMVQQAVTSEKNTLFADVGLSLFKA